MEIDDITGNWDYRTLPASIRVGEDCFLERRESFARFRSACDPGMTIGDRVHIYTWTSFSVEPAGRISIGDDTVLVGAVFMCADCIHVGSRVVISYNVTIADADFHPQDPMLRRLDAIANAPEGDRSLRPLYATRPVIIEDDVEIGIGAIVLKGVTVGRGAKVGAGAVVTRSVAPGVFVEGNPARPVGDGEPGAR